MEPLTGASTMNELTTTTQSGFEPKSLDEAIRLSDLLSKSQMVPTSYRNKPEDVFVAIAWGKEIGLAPLQALQNIAVISGKPSVYGDAAMALVLASPVCEGIEESIEGEGTANPVAVCVAKRKGRSPVRSTFSVEDAKRAGLWAKPGPWSAYPKRMLAMRARGFAIRDAFADVLKGLITAEEAQDYPQDTKVAKVVSIPTKNPLDALAAPQEVQPDDNGQQQREDEEQQQAEEERPATAQELKEQFEEAGIEIVDVQTRGNWGLYVPGKDPQWFESKADWAKAYSELADKVALAGRASPENRIEKLKELRKANEPTFNKLEPLEMTIHSRGLNSRLQELQAKVQASSPAV
jgi:hypothetical protein